MADFNFGFGIDKARRIADGIADSKSGSSLVGLHRFGDAMSCVGTLAVTAAADGASAAGLSAAQATAAAILRDTYGHVGAIVMCAETLTDMDGFAALIKAYRPLTEIIAAVPTDAQTVADADETFPVEPVQTRMTVYETEKLEGLRLSEADAMAVYAAAKVAARGDMKKKNVVAVLADGLLAADV
ncbi:MAG: hypothetical protein IJ766_07045 [Clostridia bacterium]|nr:hypothetical protein [Clostridia bacterium]